MKILVADDHDIVRLGLRQLLDQAFPNLEFHEVATGRGALEKVEGGEWDVVILDLNLPDLHGLEVLKRMKMVRPALPVIILSFHSVELFAVRAYASGASAYLAKDTVTEELVMAVKQVIAGRKYVSPVFSQQIADRLGRPVEGPPHERLTDREMEILCLLAKGKTPSEIANQLFLSVKTVSTHRSRILEKLHLTKTPELMKYALDYKLIE